MEGGISVDVAAPIETREYQNRVIDKTLNAYLAEMCKSVLIVSPTGSGKTIMALLVLKKLKEARPDMDFGWVAMRQKLLAQAREENQRVGVRDIDFVSMFSSTPPKRKLLITDEAHHDACETGTTLHKAMSRELALGLSATPQRTDRVKLAYEKTIRDCGVRYLIEQGWLSPFRQFVIPKWTPEEVANHYLREPERWGKSIFYWLSRPLSRRFEKIMRKKGIRVGGVYGDNTEEHEKIHGEFEEGKIKALTNVAMLIEGFDAPDLYSVWMRDSGRLPAHQMGGRGLRKDPKNPGKVCNIIQSVGTRYPYSKVAKPVAQYIWEEEQWLSIEANDLIEKIAAVVREQILANPVELPEYLALKRGIRSARVTTNREGETTFRTLVRQTRVDPNQEEMDF